jgi:ArsR family transcriptional regulator
MDYQAQVRILKAFADEKRLQILGELRKGERCACVLLEEIDLIQSGLSYHMKILVESGVVSARQVGKWTYYSLSARGSELVLNMLSEILTLNPDAIGAATVCSY